MRPVALACDALSQAAVPRFAAFSCDDGRSGEDGPLPGHGTIADPSLPIVDVPDPGDSFAMLRRVRAVDSSEP